MGATSLSTVTWKSCLLSTVVKTASKKFVIHSSFQKHFTAAPLPKPNQVLDRPPWILWPHMGQFSFHPHSWCKTEDDNLLNSLHNYFSWSPRCLSQRFISWSSFIDTSIAPAHRNLRALVLCSFLHLGILVGWFLYTVIGLHFQPQRMRRGSNYLIEQIRSSQTKN